MSAGVYDLKVDQGTSFGIQLQIKIDGVDQDLTGYYARSQIRKTPASSDISATFVCTVSVPLEGKIQVSLPTTESVSLSAGEYHYDLEIFTANDVIVTRILQGKVTVDQEVTR